MTDFEKLIIGFIGAILTGLITRAITNSSRNHDDIILLKSKVGELEDNQKSGIEQVKELMNLKFQHLEDKLTRFIDDMKKK